MSTVLHYLSVSNLVVFSSVLEVVILSPFGFLQFRIVRGFDDKDFVLARLLSLDW